MAVEDFTTYTEVDPNSRITVSSTKVTWASVQRDEDAYVYKDKGVNYFDENDLLKGTITSKGGRKDEVYSDIIVKSGEPFLENGTQKTGIFSIPDKKWKVYTDSNRIYEDNGYADINNYDWGYAI